MRFWDPSALVPVIVGEPTAAAVRSLLESDPRVAVAWHSEVECASAVARLERTGVITAAIADECYLRLDALRSEWTPTAPTESIRRGSVRLLRLHDLRAADALQLASAIETSEGHPGSLEFVSLNDRLVAAARLEGFPVVVPQAG
jgi:predicted nucleic acid-binding protein